MQAAQYGTYSTDSLVIPRSYFAVYVILQILFGRVQALDAVSMLSVSILTVLGILLLLVYVYMICNSHRCIEESREQYELT